MKKVSKVTAEVHVPSGCVLLAPGKEVDYTEELASATRPEWFEDAVDEQPAPVAEEAQE